MSRHRCSTQTKSMKLYENEMRIHSTLQLRQVPLEAQRSQSHRANTHRQVRASQWGVSSLPSTGSRLGQTHSTEYECKGPLGREGFLQGTTNSPLSPWPHSLSGPLSGHRTVGGALVALGSCDYLLNAIEITLRTAFVLLCQAQCDIIPVPSALCSHT